MDEGSLKYAIGLDTSQLKSGAAETRNILRGIGDNAIAEGQRVDNMFSTIGKTVGGIFALSQIKEFITHMVAVRAEVDSLQTSFNTLLGSKEAGKAMLDEIRQFAVSTPMMLNDLARGAQTMLAFNIEASKVMPMLRAIGDISMGDAAKFNSLSLAFSQMSATGKLMGQDLLQMINAGFNPLSVISEQTGKSIGELKKEMEKGAITVDMVTNAFVSATSEGGKFHGMLATQSQGIRGSISNLQGAIDDMFNEMGERSQGAITAIINAGTYLAKHYETVISIIGTLVASYGMYRAVLITNEAIERSVTASNASRIAALEAEIASIGTATVQQQLSTDADIRAAVVKGDLTAAEGLNILALKQEAAARVATLEAAAAQAAADAAAAKIARMAATERLRAAETEVMAMKMSLAAAIEKGEVFEIAVAKEKLATAQSNVNAASEEYKAAATNEATLAKAAQTAQTTANTAAQELNNISVETGTVATGKLAAVTAMFTKTLKKLWATMTAHPMGLLIGALTALGIAIYKVAAYESDAEKAQNKLNQSIADSQAKWDAEKHSIDAMFTTMRTATEGSKAYQQAKDYIISRYGDYLKGLIDEKNNLIDLAAAYDRVTTAAQTAANERMLNSAIDTANKTYDEATSGKMADLYDILKKRAPALAAHLQAQIMDDISRMGGLSNNTKLTMYEAFGVGEGNWSLGYARDSDVVEIFKIAKDIRAAQKQLDSSLKDINNTYSAGVNEFIGTSRAALEQLQSDLEDALASGDLSNFDVIVGGQKLKTFQTKADAYAALAKIKSALSQTGVSPEQKSYNDEFTAAKTRYETAAKELQRLVSAGDQYTTEEVKKAREELKAAKDALKEKFDYDVDAQTRTGAKQERRDNQIAVQTAERMRQIQQYGEQLARARRDAELEIEQAAIDAMEEGLDKDLAQNELNYKRLILANEQRRAELLENIRDWKELEWENENPTAKSEGRIFDRNTITDDYLTPAKVEELRKAAQDAETAGNAALAKSLTEEADRVQGMIDMLNNYGRVAENILNESNRKALERMLGDVMSYEQRRLKITEDFEKKRKQLYELDDNGEYKLDQNGNRILRKGVTQGNVAELDRQETDAYNAIDEQFAQREASYQAWCNRIANYSLEALQNALNNAKTLIAELEKDPNADQSKLAVLRAQVYRTEEEIKKRNAEEEVTPGTRSMKEWQDLYKTLQDVQGEFDKIGEALDGVAGEAIKTASQIAISTMSMINSIVTLMNWSTKAVEGMSASAAMLEKSSVILTAIAAAMQIATTIAGLFNNDKSHQEEIEWLQNEIDSLQWELDHREFSRFSSVDEELQRVRQAIQDTKDEMFGAMTGWARWLAYATKVSANAELLEKSAERLARIYGTMDYTLSNILGADRYTDASEQIKNLTEQQLQIEQQLNEELAMKDPDEDKITQYKQKIAELAEEAIAIINDMVEDIIGGSASDIATQLGEAFIDAFKTGEDAAEAWHDKVNDIVSDILKRMMIQKFLEEPLGEIFNKYKAIWFPNGEAADNFLDVVVDSMGDFANDLNGTISTFQTAMNELPDDLKQYFTGDSDVEGSSKGIAAASQDSIDELNGRATAIQGHTYSIAADTKIMVSHVNALLLSVMHIEEEADGFGDRMQRVESHVREVRDTLNDINTKGLRIK